MDIYKALSLLLAVAAVSTLLVGSAGFTSVSAERPVSVGVVEDSEAYVGYHPVGDGTKLSDSNETVTLVNVTNRLSSTIENISVELTKTDVSGELTQVPETIGVGETGTITAELRQTENGDNPHVSVVIRIEGDGLAVKIDGSVEERTIEFT